MFRKYGWMSAIVVDKNGRLVGVVTINDVVDVIHEEADEDIMQLAGVSEGDIYKDGLNTVKSRFVWLFTNLFVAVFVSSIVGMFEGIIAQYALLAVLMPIVASMGGNAGHQTLAVMVRAIATKELSSSNSLRVLTKEFFVGSVNGLLFALLVGVVTYFWFENKTVSYVISMAMICNLVLAGLAGAIIPLTLDKLKIDPAVSSGVFVTAFTDAGGFFIFLGLAKIFLF
jgi:magnesium transporter